MVMSSSFGRAAPCRSGGHSRSLSRRSASQFGITSLRSQPSVEHQAIARQDTEGASSPKVSEKALVQMAVTSNAPFYAVQTSSPKHRVPDCRRSSALNAQTPQSELSLADAMHQLDAGDRDRRIPEVLEA